MTEGLLGKVCIIAGTGGNIGRKAALIFARDGALVVGCGLQVDDAEATVQAVRAAGGTMISLQHADEPGEELRVDDAPFDLGGCSYSKP